MQRKLEMQAVIQQAIKHDNLVNQQMSMTFSQPKGCASISPKKKQVSKTVYFRNQGEPIQKLCSPQKPKTFIFQPPILSPKKQLVQEIVAPKTPGETKAIDLQMTASEVSLSAPILVPITRRNYFILKIQACQEIDLPYITGEDQCRSSYRYLSQFIMKQLENQNLVFKQGNQTLQNEQLQIRDNICELSQIQIDAKFQINVKYLLYKSQMDDQIIDFLKIFLNCFTFDSQFIHSSSILATNIQKYSEQTQLNIFFPLCVSEHWYGVYYVVNERKIYFFDSFNLGLQDSYKQQVVDIIWRIHQYSCEVIQLKLPEQNNSFDCGYAVFLTVYLLSRDMFVDYKISDIDRLRYFLLSWILQNSECLQISNCSDSLEIL